MVEFKSIYALYICGAGVLVLIFLSFLRFRKTEKFSKGRKAVMPEYIRKDPYYRKRLVAYQILKIMTGLVCIAGMAAAAVLIARPYTVQVESEEQYSRDIFLCMDISTSVDELNKNLVGELKEVVRELSGERFGIVIFNTSPVVLCPLTSDYEYVISVLDKVEEALEMRTEGYSGDDYESIIMLDDYISSGTLVGNMERGSSLIGDGLAATAYDFTDLEEDAERVRMIIFSTDNDIQGTPIVTLQEAADICKENNIIVYGIGTDFMYTQFREEMKDAVLSTGGKFYIEEESGSIKQIIRDIDSEARSLIKTEQYVTETEHPEKPFLCLLVSVIAMFVLLKITKR